MNKPTKANTGISFFEKYLTVWVVLCMVAGDPDRPVPAGDTEISRPVRVRPGLDPDRDPDLADDLSDDDEGRFRQHQVHRQKPERLVCHLGDQLADQALHDVCHRLVFLLMSCSSNWISPGSGQGLPGRCDPAGRCALHGDGLCLELPDQGQCGLHRRPGRDQRPDHPGRFHPDCRPAAGHQRHHDPLGDPAAVGRAVCRHSAGGRRADPSQRDQAQGHRVFQQHLSCPNSAMSRLADCC